MYKKSSIVKYNLFCIFCKYSDYLVVQIHFKVCHNDPIYICRPLTNCKTFKKLLVNPLKTTNFVYF
jgi:hypothetical protein